MNKIKFLQATSYYDKYLEKFYLERPWLKTKNYYEQYMALMNDCFSWADFWKTNLEKIGYYDVQELVINAEYLQKKWALENNFSYSNDNWMLEILEAQIAQFKPNVFFAHDFTIINSEFRKKIKKKQPSIKLILSWDGIAKNNPKIFEGCDLILSCIKFVADFYGKAGFRSYFFPLCFEKRILNKIKQRKAKFDVSFCGSIVLKKNYHNSRLNVLAELSRKSKINIWASSIENNWHLYSKNQIKRLLNKKFKEYFNLWEIGRHNRGETYGIEMYQILADSKITFNKHIDSVKTNAANLRLFEATGVGTCLLTDWKDNLSDYFEPDIEIVTYNSVPECLDKIKYLLNHEEERKKSPLLDKKGL
ncbi:glycosyltransferase [Patescibacteria group bacterium]